MFASISEDYLPLMIGKPAFLRGDKISGLNANLVAQRPRGFES
jgi:hypothetical protein